MTVFSISVNATKKNKKKPHHLWIWPTAKSSADGPLVTRRSWKSSAKAARSVEAPAWGQLETEGETAGDVLCWRMNGKCSISCLQKDAVKAARSIHQRPLIRCGGQGGGGPSGRGSDLHLPARLLCSQASREIKPLQCVLSQKICPWTVTDRTGLLSELSYA